MKLTHYYWSWNTPCAGAKLDTNEEDLELEAKEEQQEEKE